MNISQTWVSHTPDTTPNDEDNEEEFASVAAAEEEQEPLTTTRPPSPPNTFEKFFLPFDNSINTSSFALAARRLSNATPTSRKLNSTRSLASESAVTEDFASATENISITSETDLLDDISLDDSVQKGTIFNDILGKQTIIEETPEEEGYEIFEMARRNKNKKMTMTPATIETPEPSQPPKETTPEPEPEPEPVPAPPVTVEPVEVKEPTPEFDVVENVYEGAKSVWAFGKNIIVFKPFMGVAEGAATKMISLTTGISSLEEADKQIKSTLSGVDKEFIDPAILKLWSVLEPIVGKGDEVMKSVLGLVTKNVPLLEGGKKEETPVPPVEEMKKESPEAIAPETSTPAVLPRYTLYG